MSRTFSIPDQIEVEPSIPEEVVEDTDIFFLCHAFLVFLDAAGAVGDRSSGVRMYDFPILPCWLG